MCPSVLGAQAFGYYHSIEFHKYSSLYHKWVVRKVSPVEK
jgi:hypothetical protein